MPQDRPEKTLDFTTEVINQYLNKALQKYYIENLRLIKKKKNSKKT